MLKDEIPPVEQAWNEETWTFHGGSPHIDPNPMYIDFCVFHAGKHYPGKYCPHYKES